MLRGFAILLGFQLLGEVLRSLIGWPLPGPVVGMVLLTIALDLKIVPLRAVEEASEMLLGNMGLLFVPVGVGLLAFGAVLKEGLLAIGSSLVASTLLTLAVTGWVTQALQSRTQSKKKGVNQRWQF